MCKRQLKDQEEKATALQPTVYARAPHQVNLPYRHSVCSVLSFASRFCLSPFPDLGQLLGGRGGGGMPTQLPGWLDEL